jgi:hypothetical protein
MRIALQIQVRLKAYEDALNYYLERNKDQYPCDGMCPTLLELVGFRTSGTDYEIVQQLFPEFWEQKPEHIIGIGWWFPAEDVESRIEVLKKCIALANERISDWKYSENN